MTAETVSPLVWFNYAVSFSDRSVKTGVTSAPFYRLQDYLQEARRHSKRITGFALTPPAKDKETALRIERTVCEFFDVHAVDGHREWFFDDLTHWPKSLRSKYAHGLERDVPWKMRYEWDKAHERDILIDHLKRTARFRDYSRVIKFADRLGRMAGRISALKATIMAEEMVA